jgi:hypothetical protein
MQPMVSDGVFRPDDEALLGRLEDELLLEKLFAHHVGASARFASPPHPRAAGLVAVARLLPGGEHAVRAALAGDVVRLVRFVEAPPMRGKPPEMLHHLALYFGKVARTLEGFAPEAAANAWMRAMAAWLALAEERTYLASLEQAVLGGDGARGRSAAPSGSSTLGVAILPERVPFEVVAEIAKRAETSARDLAPAGRAALLALSWFDDAARLASTRDGSASRAKSEAERRRNAAIDAAIGVIAEAFDDANVRGELAAAGRALLLRAIDVWTWSGNDEAVEHFVVDRLGTVGWELYRKRSWDALRALLDPFRPLIENLAARIEKDPTKIAYAASCAQMYVFLSEVDPHLPRKAELAERAVRICPTHRNGRLVLAAILCEQSMELLRTMVFFARKDDVERAAALLDRAEKLYPQSSELPEARGMLDRVRKGRITF